MIIEKLSEKSTWTGAGKAVLGAVLLYIGQGACGAQPGIDVSSITLGQVAGHLGLTDLIGVAGLLLGGYDVVRKEGGNVAR